MTAYLFPGQGSQKIGMGEGLFDEFADLVQKADDFLGYSIAALCLKDPYGQIHNTAYTQPALYVVNALSYLKINKEAKNIKPDYFLGHSLGEYNALWAAGAFDFETGLQLVQQRGRLMHQVEGSMAAVIGLSSNQVLSILEKNKLDDLSVGNYNSYLQQVISGSKDSITQARPYFVEAGAKLYLPLTVTGAFHSPLMQSARTEFADFLKKFNFSPLNIPVIANLNASPYQNEDIYSTLSLQIDHPVQWLQSIRYLLLRGESDFKEIGTGKVLTNLVTRIVDGQ